MPKGPGSNLGKDTKIFQYFFSCFHTFDFMILQRKNNQKPLDIVECEVF